MALESASLMHAHDQQRLERIYEALSSVHHSFLHYPKKPDASVLELLERNIPHIPSETWAERLSFGGIYFNGRGVKYNFSPLIPCRLEYFEPKYSIEFPDDQIPAFDPSWIVFEDEWLLVVHKPQGLPSLPTREQRHAHLKEYLHAYVGSPIHLPSRLDTSTEGLVVVSKHPDCHNALQKLFVNRSIQKHYLFEGTGTVSWKQKTIALRVVKDPLHPVLRTASAHSGKPARTDFTYLFESSITDSKNNSLKTSLVSARPLTGRTHQIRVHARAAGIPIVGDNFYEGARVSGNDSGLRLFSWKLCFKHPMTQSPMTFISPKALWPQWSLGAYDILA